MFKYLWLAHKLVSINSQECITNIVIQSVSKGTNIWPGKQVVHLFPWRLWKALFCSLCKPRVVFWGMIQAMPTMQWEAQNSLDPLPINGWNSKTTENPISFSKVVSRGAPQWLDVSGLMLTCQFIYPGWEHCLFCVLCSDTHLHVHLRPQRLHPMFLTMQNYFSAVGFSGAEFSCPSENTKGFAILMGLRPSFFMLFLLCTSYMKCLQILLFEFFACNLYWISQCS